MTALSEMGAIIYPPVPALTLIQRTSPIWSITPSDGMLDLFDIEVGV